MSLFSRNTAVLRYEFEKLNGVLKKVKKHITIDSIFSVLILPKDSIGGKVLLI